MAYSDSANRFVKDTLASRKNESAVRSQIHRDEILKNYSSISEIETKITSLGIELLKLSISGDEELKNDVAANIALLRKEEQSLLISSGFKVDELEPKCFCKLCGDRGVQKSGEVCECAKKLLHTYTINEISKVSPLSLCSFEVFSLDYYSDDISPELGVSPKKIMKDNLRICRKFASNFPNNGENLIMLGDAGLGKTHLALSIANEIISNGFEVIYCSAVSIFKQIEIEHFNNNHELTTLNSMKRCDLLMLDDLGAEYNGPFLTSTLYDIINTRIGERRSTIFTTNFTDEDSLTRRYGEKISSRLIGCCTLLPFIGDDIRIQKNQNNICK